MKHLEAQIAAKNPDLLKINFGEVKIFLFFTNFITFMYRAQNCYVYFEHTQKPNHPMITIFRTNYITQVELTSSETDIRVY
jgi:hypothetical protein